MIDAWGPRWTKHLSDSTNSLLEWLDSLGEFSEKAIEMSFKQSKDTDAFPPSIAQFRKYAVENQKKLSQDAEIFLRECKAKIYQNKFENWANNLSKDDILKIHPFYNFSDPLGIEQLRHFFYNINQGVNYGDMP